MRECFAIDVLEELTEFEPPIDKKYVERRVQDWQRRVQTLYGTILSWLPLGWSGTETGGVPFHEEPMQRFDVGQVVLPVLLLKRGDDRAKLEPRGLWIIGANGRVDLVHGADHFLLVDRSENFDASDWQVSSLRDRIRQRPFDQEWLAEMLM